MAYYFMKLTPPRPAFPNDASAEEMAAMADHAEYMRDLVKQNIVLAAGPVRQGEGSWGVGIAQSETEDTLRALCENDPVVLAKLGFQWELFPMGSLLHKDEV
ncbi:MAG: YciI family protein [Pseudomonadota bacterium]